MLNQPDKERELTSQGVQQSVKMGSYLSRAQIVPDAILSSTAIRTVETIRLATDVMKYDKHKIYYHNDLYEASTRTFFDILTSIEDNYNNVMIVGHNPTISYITEYLTKSEIGDMATAGITCIKFNTSSWKEVSQGNGELIQYIHPGNIDN